MATELLQKTQKLVFQKNQWKMETFKTHINKIMTTQK